MQRLSANHWTQVQDHYRRVGGRTEGAEGNCNPIGRTTVLTNLDTSGLPDEVTNQSAFMGWSMDPSIYVVE